MTSPTEARRQDVRGPVSIAIPSFSAKSTLPMLAAAPADPTTDIGGLLATLRRHMTSIMVTTLALLALAGVYLAMATPMYTATTSLLIDPRLRKIVADEVLQSGIGVDLVLVESQISLIGSDAVLSRVIEKEKLVADPDFVKPKRSGLLRSVREALVGRATESSSPMDEALSTLSRMVKVKRAQKTYVVDIDVTATTAPKAARLADAIASAYIADQIESKSSEARRASEMIDGRLGELRDKARNAELRVDEFKKANQLFTAEGGNVDEQQLNRLTTELVTARAVAAESKARLDELTALMRSGAGPESLPEAIKSNLIQRLREQYATASRREAGLLAQLQPRHPLVVEARSQLADIRSQINAELRRISAATQTEAQIAQSREKEIASRIEQQKQEVSRNNTAQLRLSELEREAQASRDVLRTYLQRAKETQEQQSLSAPEARIISPASIPTRTSRPLTLLILTLAGLGGLGLGIARALLSDHLTTGLRSPDQVSAATGLTLLASIPALPPRSRLTRVSGRLRGERDGTAAVTFGDLMTAVTDGQRPSDAPFRQAIMRLSRRLKSRAAASVPPVHLIISGYRAAGASGTALSLAYAAALTGERTLLVDAASPNPELSRIFASAAVSPTAAELENADYLGSIAVRDSVTGLAMLPIALADLRRLKTFDRQRLVQGLTMFAREFDTVVIDAGAMLEDEAAAVLAPLATAIVLVARSEVTDRDTLNETMQALESHRDKIAGVVLTMIKSDAQGK